MLILESWTPSTLIDTNLVFLMKSTPVHHGVVISHLGNYQSEPEWSSRRNSVIELSDGKIHFIIGSIAYKSGYDTEDPLASLKKYSTGEWKDLLIKEFPGPIEEAVKWDGTVNRMNDISF